MIIITRIKTQRLPSIKSGVIKYEIIKYYLFFREGGNDLKFFGIFLKLGWVSPTQLQKYSKKNQIIAALSHPLGLIY